MPDPPSGSRRIDELVTKTEIFETGIKVVDLIEPLRQGR